MDSTATTTFDRSDVAKTFTLSQKMDYNLGNLQMASRKTPAAEASKVLLERFKYLTDYSYSSVPWMQQMFNLSMTGPSIEKTISKVDKVTGVGTVLSGQVSVFSPNPATNTGIVLDKIYNLETADGISTSAFVPSGITGAALTTDVNYKLKQTHKYDALGVVEQIQVPNNIPVSYKWSYNNSLPVAEIKNAQNNQYRLYQTAQNTGSTAISPSSTSLPFVQQDYTIVVDYSGPVTLKISVSGNPSYATSLSYSGIATGSIASLNKNTGCIGNVNVINLGSKLPGTYNLHIELTAASPASTVGACGTIEYPKNVMQWNTYGTSEFFVENFEETGNTTDASTSHTGVKYNSTPYTIPFTTPNAPNSRTYAVEYWVRNASNVWQYVGKDAGGGYRLYTNNMVIPTSAGTAVDDIRVFPIDAQIKTYTYDPIYGMTSEINETGFMTKYNYDPFGQLNFISDDDGKVLKTFDYRLKTQSSSTTNYVASNTLLVGNVTDPITVAALPVESKSLATTYYDGLGRPIQSVAYKASPLKNDIVTPNVYDVYGREYRKYLPVVAGNDGLFKSGLIDVSGNYAGAALNFYNNGLADKIADDTKPFAETIFEQSPLNRPLKQGAPGVTWQPSGDPDLTTDHTVKKNYLTNVANEILFITVLSGGQIAANTGAVVNYYPAGQLTCMVSYDENNNEVREYTNKEGHMICKKNKYGVDAQQAPLYTFTYYIYNDMGDLTVVLPPEGVKSLMQTLQN